MRARKKKINTAGEKIYKFTLFLPPAQLGEFACLLWLGLCCGPGLMYYFLEDD